MPRRASTLADIGEKALIEHIAHLAGRSVGSGWALSIGDDAAILRPRSGEELVISTDAQVESVHFRFGRESLRSVGRRALIVNLSDLAAMGARPVGVFLSLAAPRAATFTRFDGIVRGFVEEAERHRCPLVGGTLSRAPQWSLHVTVVGACRRGRALRRRGVRPGDLLYVTGSLGRGALARLRADALGRPLTFLPTPRLQAGRALARLPGTRSCIDISDGLAMDLENLLAQDGLGAEIDANRLPRPRGFARACGAIGVDPLSVIAAGGEDYELLFAFRAAGASSPDPMLEAKLGLPVTRIGRVVREVGIRGLPVEGSPHHF